MPTGFGSIGWYSGMALPTVFSIHTFHATLILSVIGAA
jgi:hypothetical protein